jgi:adenosylmethionine-8-amino-7-oxononanoate aminotransferase
MATLTECQTSRLEHETTTGAIDGSTSHFASTDSQPRRPGWFALQGAEVIPDLFCMAKGITSGYVPFGGVGMSAAIAECIHTAPPDLLWWHALTAAAHPVGCAVALENMRILEQGELLARAAALGRRLQARLRETFGADPRVREIRAAGLLAGVEFIGAAGSEDGARRSSDFGARLLRAARSRGLHSRVRGSTFQFAPPYCATFAEIDRMVAILAQAANACLDEPQ